MRKNPRLLLLGILLLVVLSIFIILPAFEKNLKVGSSNRNINFNQNNILGKLKIQRELLFRQGLDLRGGASITFKAEMKDVPSVQQDSALESAKTVIERRVDLFGVSEPIVRTTKVGQDRRIVVEIPGVTDVNEAISLIGATAQLTFWEAGASASAEPVKTDLTGSDLKSTGVVFDPNNGKPQVQLNFTSEGAKKFADITKRNVGKVVAIVLDNALISQPTVNEPILTGDAVISGEFTPEEAKALSTQLNAGALPVPLTVLEQHVVGPSLGKESLQKSLFAGFIGLLSILIFMVVQYGKRGFVADIALIFYAIFTLAIFKLSSLTPYGITLTLAGIAGFVLSIGMAVDANILIFERTKEEERAGKSHTTAIEMGFSRAWTSIRDSNVSTLITCLILYTFGTGIVKGFALVLAIGVMVSMFTAITVTRSLLRVFTRN